MHDGLSGIFLLFFNFLQMYFVYKCKRTYIKEVLMGRRKCLIIPVLMAGILLMGGCSRQSIEDVKRFQETSTAVENQTNQTGIIQENESRENKVDNVFEGMVSSSPKYAERYSDVDMEIHTGKLVTKFTYSIGETAIAENVDELSKLMSEEDIAEYVKYDA